MIKIQAPNHPEESDKGTKQSTRNHSNSNQQIGYIVVPYINRVSESVKTACGRHGIQVHFKEGKTIKDLLMEPKDKDCIIKKSGVTYRFKWDRVECDQEYIGKSSRSFGERFKEHLKPPSTIYYHFKTTGHTTTLEHFRVVGWEDQSFMRLAT